MIEDGIDITVVLADRTCDGLKIAEAAGIETILLSRKEFGFPGKKFAKRWPKCSSDYSTSGWGGIVMAIAER